MGRMAKLDKVVMMNHKKGQTKNVFGTIHTFLIRKGQDSYKTRESYESSIRDFFHTMRDKTLEQLVPEDLVFEKSQIRAYQVALKERYKGATVNNALSAIKECYKQFADDGFAVDVSIFDIERYDGHDSDTYGILTHEEVLEILNLISKTRKGRDKALLIRVAYATAYRKSSLMEAKYNQIVDINGTKYLMVVGKGNKKRHKKLSPDLYEELMQLKKTNKASDEDNIFNLSKKTIDKMMEYIRKNMDFGERWIVFHSFKKASINEVNLVSGGDIKAIQAHGDHSKAETAMNYYMANKELDDLVEVDIYSSVPIDKLDNLSHEELLSLIKNSPRDVQVKLLRGAKLL